jgi:hypothetical protein
LIVEDLVPFLIFIVIALINLVKFIMEKGAKGRPPAGKGGAPPERKRSGLEDLFEELARKLEPPATPIPADWPDEIEDPDFMEAFEEFEDPVVKAPVKERPSPIAVEPLPAMRMKAPEPMEHAARKPMPTQSFNMQGLRISSSFMPRSSGGSDMGFSLGNRKKLRQAIIANVVLNRPRAYDAHFENTVVR